MELHWDYSPTSPLESEGDDPGSPGEVDNFNDIDVEGCDDDPSSAGEADDFNDMDVDQCDEDPGSADEVDDNFNDIDCERSEDDPSRAEDVQIEIEAEITSDEDIRKRPAAQMHKRPAKKLTKAETMKKLRASFIESTFETFLRGSTLRSAVTHKELSGGGHRLKDTACNAAYQAYVEMQKRITDFVGAACAMSKRKDEEDPTKPVTMIQLFIRKRKYDEAETRCEVDIESKPIKIGVRDSTFVEASSVKKQKILVTEASWMMSLKRSYVSTKDSVLTLMGCQPTHLASIESTAAECVHEVHRRQLAMPYDYDIDSNARVIELHIHDEHRANCRSERAFQNENPNRAECGVTCDAHKKAQITTESFKAIRPLDSQVVRMGLSFKSGVKNNLKDEMRRVIVEQIRISVGGVNTVEADRHRKEIFDLHLTDSPTDKWRRAVLEQLFNGDIRKHGVVEHIEVGCCSSAAETVHLMCTIGIAALLPRKHTIGKLDRKNWTGAGEAFSSIGLPASVHGLFACAYIRSTSHGAPADTGGHNEGDPGLDKLCDDQVDPPENDLGECTGLYDEDEATQVLHTQKWIFSGSFVDDINIARIALKPQEKYLLNQLKMSSARWERKQQDDFIKKGKRQFQVSRAYNGDDDFEFLKAATANVFNDSAWRLIHGRDEVTQLKVFRMGVRAGAVGYQLLRVRHRRGPFDVIASCDDEEEAKRVAAKPICTLCGYGENFTRFYGADWPGDPHAYHEQKCMQLFVETDSVSCERSHSWYHRRCAFNTWTHMPMLWEVSARWFANYVMPGNILSTMDSNTENGEGKTNTCRKKRFDASKQAKPAQRRGGGGAWRAFLSIESAGARVDGLWVTEMSLRYKRLTDDQRAYYNEMGVLATQQHGRGEKTFIKKPHAKKRSNRAIEDAAPQPLHAVEDEDEDPFSEVVAIRELPVVPLDNVDVTMSKITLEAKAALTHARAVKRAEAEEYNLIENELSKMSKRTVREVEAEWAFNSDRDNDDEQVCGPALTAVAAMSTPSCLCLQKMKPMQLAAAQRGADPGAHATSKNLWKRMHMMIKRSDCQPLGKIPMFNRPCFEAERCVHEGDGELLARLNDKYNDAHSFFKKALGTRNHKYRINIRGDVVIRLWWQEDILQPGDATPPYWPPDDDSYSIESESLVHLSFFRGNPTRPTFTKMISNPLEDDAEAGLRGVSPMRDNDGEGIASWRTVWEVLDGLHEKDVQISIEWHELVARKHKKVDAIRPWLQRIRRLPYDAKTIWEGKTAETEAMNEKKTRNASGSNGPWEGVGVPE